MEQTKVQSSNKSGGYPRLNRNKLFEGDDLIIPTKHEVNKYIDEVTDGKELFNTRVSKETPPKNLAISISMAIQEGKAVKVSGVGAAVTTVQKALASVESYLYPMYDIQYKPIQEPKRDNKNSENPEDDKFVVLSTLVYDRNRYKRREPDFESEIIVKDILNNKQLIESTIEIYAEKGYSLDTLTSIDCEGRTSYLYGVFKKCNK